jgi:hypothetical protein
MCEKYPFQWFKFCFEKMTFHKRKMCDGKGCFLVCWEINYKIIGLYPEGNGPNCTREDVTKNRVSTLNKTKFRNLWDTCALPNISQSLDNFLIQFL